MNKKSKLIASVLSITVLASSILTIASFGGKNIFIKSKAAIVSNTITFSKTDSLSYQSKINSDDSSRYDNTLISNTSNGATYNCIITKSTSDVSSESNYSMGTIDSTDGSMLSIESSYSSSSKVFQKITNITVYTRSTASRTVRLYFNGSSDTYSSLTVSARSGGVDGSASFDTADLDFTAKSFNLVYQSAYSYTFSISKLVISYECSTDYSDDAILDSISVDTSLAKTSYTVGETFSSSGIVVTARYTDLTTNVISSGYTVSEPDTSTAGTKTVTVSYSENNVTATATYQIEVEEVASGLTGTYSGTYSSITFTDSSHGSYSYSSYTVYFTYVLSNTSITFTYVSGDNDDFGNYKLFSNTSTPNSTGVVVSDTQIQVTTYNNFGSTTKRTFTKS